MTVRVGLMERSSGGSAALGEVRKVEGLANLKARDLVIFTDSRGCEHPALITRVFGQQDEAGKMIEVSCANLVYVSESEADTDDYGRQIKRETSVVHVSKNAAGRMCWRLP